LAFPKIPAKSKYILVRKKSFTTPGGSRKPRISPKRDPVIDPKNKTKNTNPNDLLLFISYF
jgi:hypothetical protein